MELENFKDTLKQLIKNKPVTSNSNNRNFEKKVDVRNNKTVLKNTEGEKKVIDNNLIDPIKWTDYISPTHIDYSKYSDSYSIHHYGSKSINGNSWQSNSEIMFGMLLHYFKKYWKLSAVVIVLLILDHTNSIL